jgi:Mor family transcriptional regulator
MDAKMSDNLHALFNAAYYIAKNNKQFSIFSELLQLTTKLGAELCDNINEKNAKTITKKTKVIESKM